MRTNSKQVREQIKKHIIDCVSNSEGNYYNNVKDAANRLYSEFNRVANYGYNLKKFPNEQERFSDYLQGIPFDFEYWNEGIQEYLNNLGINPQKKVFPIEKSIALYHYLIFSEVMKNKTI